jgi:O-antigen/teichoic acid export membrane protein
MRLSAASVLVNRARRIAAVARLRPFETASVDGRSRERYRRIVLGIASGFLARSVAALAGLALVPILLAYLGKAQFGLWAAASALVAWLGLLDLGISPSLINALAEAHGRNDRVAATRHATTAAALLGVIAIAAGLALAALSRRIAWDALLGVSGQVPAPFAAEVVTAAAAVTLIGLPLAVVQSCYAAFQIVHLANAFAVGGSVLTLAVVWLGVTVGSDLPALILLMGAVSLGLGAVSLVVLTRVLLPWLRLRAAHLSWTSVRTLLRLALPLFLFQIGALAVNQSQVIILARVGSLETVADYAVLLRLIAAVSGLTILGANTFVPFFREATRRGDMLWVRRGFDRLLWLRMAVAAAGGAVLVAAGNGLLHLWLRRSDVGFGPGIWIGAAIFIAASAWVNAHSDLLIAFDRIWVQVGLVGLNGAGTVLLTLLLAPRYGVLGALIALASTTVAGWTWLFPLLARPMLKPGT